MIYATYDENEDWMRPYHKIKNNIKNDRNLGYIIIINHIIYYRLRN